MGLNGLNNIMSILNGQSLPVDGISFVGIVAGVGFFQILCYV